jgi:predicted HTH transcriptional regulator
VKKGNFTAEQLEVSAWAAALKSSVVTDVVPPGWFTPAQLAEKLGMTSERMKRRITELMKLGKCETQKFRVSNGGRGVYPLPHYKLK